MADEIVSDGSAALTAILMAELERQGFRDPRVAWEWINLREAAVTATCPKCDRWAEILRVTRFNESTHLLLAELHGNTIGAAFGRFQRQHVKGCTKPSKGRKHG